MEKNKQKLLAVLDILNETDELHPITANRITERLRLMGIEAERKSVLRDIAALSEYGCDIILHPDNKLGFYIGSRTFEDWELKILMDSVHSSRFLTAEQTKSLTERISRLSSAAGCKALRSVTQIHWENKSGSVSYAVDKILNAIQHGMMITFQYSFTSADLKKSLKRSGYIYTVSPYSIYRRGDQYYLIGNTHGYGNLSCYRLDRMRNAAVSELPAVPAEKLLGKNPDMRISEYVQSTISNFSGEKIPLELHAEPSALDDIIDCFGEKIRVTQTESGLTVKLRTTESEGLYHWLMQMCGKITATSPQSVVDEMARRTQTAAETYGAISRPCSSGE